MFKSTSFENEEERPAKTLEELKIEQQAKIWSYKENNIKDLQDFIKCNENIAPESFKQQQKTLQDLDDELDIMNNLITDENTNIIVQIQDEKEKEISNFMNDVKSYVNSATKTDQNEEEFRKQVKSYLDLIDTQNDEAKVSTFPELHLNRINKMKKQLLDTNNFATEGKKIIPPVRKLDRSVLNPLQNQDTLFKTLDKKDIEINKKNILSIKDIYEQSKPEITSPKVCRQNINNPVLEKLKSLKSNDKTQNLKFQLANKSKTIYECHEYIESHEDISSPKIIEIINNFKIARKEEDKANAYNKFLECAHVFIQQISRSDEQKVFKENIKAYLDIIENSDPLLNGTPKLKKHAACTTVISSNNKKDQIEKDGKNVANILVREKTVLTPDEKRKEILSKYGIKDRARQPSVESTSSSIDEDITEEIKHLSDKELCLKYGLPELYLPEEQKIESQRSNYSLLSLLSKIRNTSNSRVSPKETSHLLETCTQISNDISKDLPKNGVTSKMKNIFEQLPVQESPQINRRNVTRKEDIRNTEFLFDLENASPKTPRKFSMLQRSSTISNIGNFPKESLQDKSSFHTSRLNQLDSRNEVERFPLFPVERCSSFSKVKNAFENGVGLNEDSNNDSDCDNYVPNHGIASELEALKRDNKIKNMLRLCRSDSDPSRSPKSSRALDKSTLQQVAKSKSAITSMFESQGPKITFGGSKPKVEQLSPVKKPEKVQSTPLDSRKWVFDTIQKYFDVIVEEEQEIENEKEELTADDILANDDDQDNESDYTSAEEEIPSTSPFSPKVTISNKFNLQSFFQKDQVRRCSSVTGQPVRKVSIDDFVADAAKKFDELTNGSDLSLEDPDLTASPNRMKNKPLPLASSCQNINQLAKSGTKFIFTI